MMINNANYSKSIIQKCISINNINDLPMDSVTCVKWFPNEQPIFGVTSFDGYFRLYNLDFSDKKINGIDKNIPLETVLSLEIKSDNRTVYLAGSGYNSLFGYTSSSCIYVFDVLTNQIKGRYIFIKDIF